jgi:hypothetical protein
MIAREPLRALARQWAPPRGLERSRPRDVSFTPAGWGLAIFSGALVAAGLVAGFVLFVGAASQQQERLRLRADGVDTDAVVTRLWVTKGDSPRHYAAFQFEADGRQVSGSQRLSRAAWNRLHVGSTIPVRYTAGNPLVYSALGRDRGAVAEWMAYAAGLGLAALGALVVVPLVRQRRLLVEGRPAPGLVIKRRTTRTQHGTHHEIRYEFALINGAAHAGKSAARKYQEGQSIAVLYEPDNPARNAPYPLALVRLARP